MYKTYYEFDNNWKMNLTIQVDSIAMFEEPLTDLSC